MRLTCGKAAAVQISTFFQRPRSAMELRQVQST
jgi:hypothetical protein